MEVARPPAGRKQVDPVMPQPGPDLSPHPRDDPHQPVEHPVRLHAASQAIRRARRRPRRRTGCRDRCRCAERALRTSGRPGRTRGRQTADARHAPVGPAGRSTGLPRRTRAVMRRLPGNVMSPNPMRNSGIPPGPRQGGPDDERRQDQQPAEDVLDDEPEPVREDRRSADRRPSIVAGVSRVVSSPSASVVRGQGGGRCMASSARGTRLRGSRIVAPEPRDGG